MEEATLFYRKVQQIISSLQQEIDDEDQLLPPLPYYLFTHHPKYTKWLQQVQEMYQNINTFDQLLQTNLLFFQGKIPMTFYHYTPVYDVDLNSLIPLTKKGIFTMNGQSSLCTKDVLQKPYLMGLIHNDTWNQVIQKLLKSREFYFQSYTFSTEDYQNTFPKEKYVVTLEDGKPFTTLSESSLQGLWDTIEDYTYLSSTLKSNLLKNTTIFQIAGKDYCKGNVENYLLGILR